MAKWIGLIALVTIAVVSFAAIAIFQSGSQAGSLSKDQVVGKLTGLCDVGSTPQVSENPSKGYDFIIRCQLGGYPTFIRIYSNHQKFLNDVSAEATLNVQVSGLGDEIESLYGVNWIAVVFFNPNAGGQVAPIITIRDAIRILQLGFGGTIQ
jgi:hypothetical protein